MRKLPVTAAEELLDIVMRRYERTSTLLPRIVPLKIRASYWEIAPASPPCSTVYSIMVMYSNVVPGVGARE
jgi:hypothetical protein